MSWLKNLFKKKPGGTALGNLFRGVSSALTGGALGQGLNKIELGQTQTNKELAQQQANNPSSTGGQGTSPPPNNSPPDVGSAISQLKDGMSGIVDKIKDITTIRTEVKGDNNQILLIGGVAVAVALIFSMNKGQGRRY